MNAGGKRDRGKDWVGATGCPSPTEQHLRELVFGWGKEGCPRPHLAPHSSQKKGSFQSTMVQGVKLVSGSSVWSLSKASAEAQESTPSPVPMA